MIETVRVSQKAKDQLIQLKRRTGLDNWNVLCRWALCESLKEPSCPPAQDLRLDSNIEMTWRTFAGNSDKIYLAALAARCEADGLEPTESNIASMFNLHLHRGIARLFGNKRVRTIEDLVALAVS